MSGKADRSGTVQPNEEEAYGGILSFYINTWKEGVNWVEPSSFQWYPLMGQEAMDTDHCRSQVVPSEHQERLLYGVTALAQIDATKLCPHLS